MTRRASLPHRYMQRCAKLHLIEWRTIDTGPREGSILPIGPRVLLWYADFGASIGCWQLDHWRHESAPNDAAARAIQPTHWAPLPEGPK